MASQQSEYTKKNELDQSLNHHCVHRRFRDILNTPHYICHDVFCLCTRLSVSRIIIKDVNKFVIIFE